VGQLTVGSNPTPSATPLLSCRVPRAAGEPRWAPAARRLREFGRQRCDGEAYGLERFEEHLLLRVAESREEQVDRLLDAGQGRSLWRGEGAVGLNV
jgi:hypothetical protein